MADARDPPDAANPEPRAVVERFTSGRAQLSV